MCEQSQANINVGFGCQALICEDEKCGEIKSLDILKEFQRLYEHKLHEIGDDCSCPTTKIKNKVLQDWVKDLTEQNTLLVQVVEELEHEASERVALLEDKLKNSSKTSFEIMQTLQDYDAQNISNQSDFINKITHYQSDINTLIEYIKRIKDEGTFNLEGFHFYNIAHEDIYDSGDATPVLLRSQNKEKELEAVISKLKSDLSMHQRKQHEYEREINLKEKICEDQHGQIQRLNDAVDRYSCNAPDRQRLLDELHELRTELKARNEDFNRLELYDTRENGIDEAYKIQIADLEEQNGMLRQTISNANAELNDLRGFVENYTTNKYRNKHYDFSDTVLLLRSANTSESIGTDNISQDSDDFNRTMYLLKAEINKMVRLVSEQIFDGSKSNGAELTNVLSGEISNKDKLIKNKDEMIKIQNDSLTLAQDELKILQTKVYELESDRDIKMQEIKNLRQALQLNQNSIEELKNSLRTSEEKISNMQQTVDLYLESIEMLENSKLKAETEVEQQRITIRNLQEALVNVKQQLEGVQSRNTSEVSISNSWTSRWTGNKVVHDKTIARRSVHDI